MKEGGRKGEDKITMRFNGAKIKYKNNHVRWK